MAMISRTYRALGPHGFHRVHYTEWGDPTNPKVLICAHGMTRTCRDFDFLAAALERDYRVICPDVVGRGESDWLKEPMGYQFPTYVGDMLTLLGTLAQQAPIGRFDWVGTSMGGLIGLMLAGAPDLPLPAPLRRLVLNDVGPVIEWQALQRIGQYLGKSGPFESVEAGAACLRALAPGFGPHTDAQWLALSRPMLRARPEGDWRLHYDPAIAVPYAAVTPESSAQGEALLWQLYDRVKADTLLLRGAESDLLSAATASAMQARGPRPRLLEFAGVGHAPTLVADDQVAAVLDFLLPAGEAP